MIANAIIGAQIASDGGKGIYELSSENKSQHDAGLRRYGAKVEQELIALNLINNNPKCGFTYWVTKEGDQNGYPSILVYFNVDIKGEILQISFHNPVNQAGDLVNFCGKGRRTKWDRNIGGSRKACSLLQTAIKAGKL